MPPKYIRAHTIAHRAKATPAVTNQPPMTDMTPVTRNTALSRPQARSARRTHGNHKSYVSGRKGQLIVGTGNYKHGGENKIYRRTHLVERRSLCQNSLTAVETSVHDVVYTARHNLRNNVTDVLSGTDDAARHLGRAEHLVALVLTTEVYAGLDNVLCFL